MGFDYFLPIIDLFVVLASSAERALSARVGGRLVSVRTDVVVRCRDVECKSRAVTKARANKDTAATEELDSTRLFY